MDACCLEQCTLACQLPALMGAALQRLQPPTAHGMRGPWPSTCPCALGRATWSRCPTMARWTQTASPMAMVSCAPRLLQGSVASLHDTHCHVSAREHGLLSVCLCHRTTLHVQWHKPDGWGMGWSASPHAARQMTAMCCAGVWADTDWHGERVQGVWEHGMLKGPFKARETGVCLWPAAAACAGHALCMAPGMDS